MKCELIRFTLNDMKWVWRYETGESKQDSIESKMREYVKRVIYVKLKCERIK